MNQKSNKFLAIIMVVCLILGYLISCIPIFNFYSYEYNKDLERSVDNFNRALEIMYFPDDDEDNINDQVSYVMFSSIYHNALDSLMTYDYKELDLNNWDEYETVMVFITYKLVLTNKLMEFKSVDEEIFNKLQEFATRYRKVIGKVEIIRSEDENELADFNYRPVIDSLYTEPFIEYMDDLIYFIEEITYEPDDERLFGTYYNSFNIDQTPFCK